MKTLKFTITALICTLFGTMTSLEQNPQSNEFKKAPNLYDIQREAEKTWENGKSRKGTGYKPYKRWEHFMQTRTANAEGDIVNMGKEIWTAINNNHAYRFGLGGEVCTGANWQNLGPSQVYADHGYYGYGRINFIKFYPQNSPTHIYVGAAGGGIWRKELITPNNCEVGSLWQPLSDYELSHNDLCVLGVSDLIIHPTNPDIMWVGTGDQKRAPGGNGFQTNVYSLGVLKTINGGVSWETWTLDSDLDEWTQDKGWTIKKLNINPTNPNVLFAGTNDGLFKTDDGNTWEKKITSGTFDDIEFKFGDPNIIYASSLGEIRRSDDGGNTWDVKETFPFSKAPAPPPNELDDEWFPGRTELALHPDFPNYVYVLVVNGSSGGLGGIYRSTDMGNTFTKLYGEPDDPNEPGYSPDINLLNRNFDAKIGNGPNGDNNGQGNYDLAFVLDPNDPTGQTIYVGGINIWKSTDGGVSWNGVSNWTPSVSLQNESVMCISGELTNSDPIYSRSGNGSPCETLLGDYYYDIIQFNGVGTSGVTVSVTFDNGENGFLAIYPYDFNPEQPCSGNPSRGNSLTVSGTNKYTIVISTENPNIIGSYEISFDTEVEPINYGRHNASNYVHADIHCLAFNGTDLYAGSDGGVYKSEDDGVNWLDENNGLSITQYYGFSQHNGKIVGGTQDNGVMVSNDLSENKWKIEIKGDGGECYVEDNIAYATNNNGGIHKSIDGGETWQSILGSKHIQDYPCTKNELAPLIFNALAVQESNPNILYVGYQNIHKSTNGGAGCTSWSEITSSSSTWAANPYFVHRIEIAPSNPNYVYALKGQDVFRNLGGGSGTWTKIPNLPPFPPPTDIAIKDNDPNTIWISFGGYDAARKVIKAHYDGTMWIEENLSGTLPNLPINTIVYEGAGKNRIYVGADVGVYYLDDDLIDANDDKCWQIFNNSYTPGGSDTPLPNVIVSELEISDGNLFAATFGRGIWKSPLAQGTCLPDCNAGGPLEYEYEKLCDPVTGEFRLQIRIIGNVRHPIIVSGDYNAILDVNDIDLDGTFTTNVIDNSDGSNDFEIDLVDDTNKTLTISGGFICNQCNDGTNNNPPVFLGSDFLSTYICIGNGLVDFDATATDADGHAVTYDLIENNFPADESLQLIEFGGNYYLRMEMDNFDYAGQSFVVSVIAEDVNPSGCSHAVCKEFVLNVVCGTAPLYTCTQPCPSCTDGIQNQGETAVDCGGPCDPCCDIFTISPQITDEIIDCDGSIIRGEVLFVKDDANTCDFTVSHGGWSGNPFTEVSSGWYEFQITIDENGYTYSYPIVEVNSDVRELTLSAQIENQLNPCASFNPPNGSLGLSVSGGSGPFDYIYSTNCTGCTDRFGSGSADIQTGLCQGVYAVTVTDAGTGCTATFDFEVALKTKAEIIADFKAGLEGPYERIPPGGLMLNNLRIANLLPIGQPYNKPPWNYAGNEAVDSIQQMPIDAVDWILVMARHKRDNSLPIDTAAGILLADGNVVAPNGDNFKFLELYPDEEYYYTVHHRNHLAVMSSQPVMLPDSTTVYDFTESMDKAMGTEQMRRILPEDVYVLCAGDINADGTISAADYNEFYAKLTNTPGYHAADLNMDGIVDWDDFPLLHNNASAIGIWQLRH